MAVKAAEQFPHLARAPITEAIIDFRVKLPEGFDITKFSSLRNELGDEYPHCEEKKLVEYGFEQQAGKPPMQSVKDLGIHGYFFKSADEKNIAQFRRDGFTFNRLKPYTSWNEVFSEASRLWNIYLGTVLPVEVSRIAVRYLNRLIFPTAVTGLSNYLVAAPSLPNNVPANLNSFFTRLVVQDTASGSAANVVQALEGSLDNQLLQVILDIDAYRANVSDLQTASILAEFAKLRELKNRIFFGSLTEEAINLFR